MKATILTLLVRNTLLLAWLLSVYRCLLLGTTTKAGTCQTNKGKDAKVAPASYTDVKKNDDSAMISALNKQPVSVAIEADQQSFQLYKSGVFTGTCGASLDHGVLAVGYGTDSSSGLDFYKVKNSWGTTWGEGGYIRMQRGGNLNKGAGQCGILSGPPSYPNLLTVMDIRNMSQEEFARFAAIPRMNINLW